MITVLVESLEDMWVPLHGHTGLGIVLDRGVVLESLLLTLFEESFLYPLLRLTLVLLL